MKRYTKDVSECYNCPRFREKDTGGFCGMALRHLLIDPTCGPPPSWCPLPDAPEPATPKPLEAWTDSERSVIADALDAAEEGKEEEKT